MDDWDTGDTWGKLAANVCPIAVNLLFAKYERKKLLTFKV